jgi:hypothetical protein
MRWEKGLERLEKAVRKNREEMNRDPEGPLWKRTTAISPKATKREKKEHVKMKKEKRRFKETSIEKRTISSQSR